MNNLTSSPTSQNAKCLPLNCEQVIQQFMQQLPKGARICHRTLTNGGLLWDDKSACESNLIAHSTWVDGQPGEVLHFGIPRDPVDFIKEAIEKGHPRDIVAKVPEVTKRLLDSMSSLVAMSTDALQRGLLS